MPTIAIYDQYAAGAPPRPARVHPILLRGPQMKLSAACLALFFLSACKPSSPTTPSTTTPTPPASLASTTTTQPQTLATTPLDFPTARAALVAFLQNPPDARLKQALPVLQSPATTLPSWGTQFGAEGWQIHTDTKSWLIIFWTTERGTALKCAGTFTQNPLLQWQAQLTETRRFSQLP